MLLPVANLDSFLGDERHKLELDYYPAVQCASVERMLCCLRGFGFTFQDSCTCIFADGTRLVLRLNESFIFILAHVPFFLLRQPVSCSSHRMSRLSQDELFRSEPIVSVGYRE